MRMMADDESALSAAADIVRAIAADADGRTTLFCGGSSQVRLPGFDSSAKASLERELSALVIRVQRLEAKASIANAPIFPDTPNETADPLFGDELNSPTKFSMRGRISTSNNARNGSADERPVLSSPLVDTALEGLREHIDDQAKLIDSQRSELTNVTAQLLEQQRLQESGLHNIVEERVGSLERELYKHQKANEAFQKALREIGEIITAVARGDLSKRVRQNSVDMDPEITNFKKTINTMLDQLSVFSSEVSRVAKEVGTDGMLGGQARIEGVDGTWKELTDNGKFAWPPILLRSNHACTVNVMAQNLTDQGKSKSAHKRKGQRRDTETDRRKEKQAGVGARKSRRANAYFKCAKLHR